MVRARYRPKQLLVRCGRRRNRFRDELRRQLELADDEADAPDWARREARARPGTAGKLFINAMMRPRASSVSPTNASDGITTMPCPPGRTPFLIMTASSASLYFWAAAVRLGATIRAIIGSSNMTIPSASLPWQPAKQPRTVASRRPSMIDAGSVGID